MNIYNKKDYDTDTYVCELFKEIQSKWDRREEKEEEISQIKFSSIPDMVYYMQEKDRIKNSTRYYLRDDNRFLLSYENKEWCIRFFDTARDGRYILDTICTHENGNLCLKIFDNILNKNLNAFTNGGNVKIEFCHIYNNLYKNISKKDLLNKITHDLNICSDETKILLNKFIEYIN
jgi:hypothetical protein